MFTPKWELAVFRNRLRLTDRKTGTTAERSAIHLFSTAATLIANRECLEQEFRELAVQMPRGFIFRYPEVEVVSTETPLQPVERQALYGAIADAGASKVLLPDG